MNQEALAVIAENGFSKLLQSPGCGRMSGDVTVQNAATANFHNHEDIQQAESCRDRHQGISCYHGLGRDSARSFSSATRRFCSCHPSDRHFAASILAPFGVIPGSRALATTPPLPAPHPRWDSPGPSVPSIAEDPPESAIVTGVTSTATIA